MGDGEPRSGNDPDDRDDRDDGDAHDEDRDAIFARRKLLVSAALVGMTLPVEGCDWLQEKFGARSAPCLTAPIPQVCLAYQPEPADVTVQAQPCLTPAQSTACLSVTPAACLMINVPRSTDRARPRPCLSQLPPEPTERSFRRKEKGDGDKDE